ncbi:hypothetical protein Poly30_28980 [Planctomycetes bacterium Poly30]|uniref:Uncharacterized protein n=1 Tax=Saltatorellus ferox TaxID=2528018 RepID=A0A518ETF6_9BACT|nr:hypothetical protein Poly30_28980 [Planctomycetes bacterium Poly30]
MPASDGWEASRPVGGGIPAALLVSAIAILVVVVSMPRFRAHVLEANREDAKLTIGLLGGAVFRNTLPRGVPMIPDSEGDTPGAIPASLRHLDSADAGLFELVRDVKRLKHRFPDARRTGTSGELLHHGYRFATGYVYRNAVTEKALVAWPDAYDKSGDIAFATVSSGAIYGHPNGGLWSGADRSSTVEARIELTPGGTQALFHVDLSDESWVLIQAPIATGE